MIKSKNVFYVSNFNTIGGVETYIYELARKYKDYDITIIYKTGDVNQIKRIREYVRILRYTGEPIECDRAFFNYETDIIDKIKAKEYIQLIHAMFKTQGIHPRIEPKITQYFCVSESAGKEWEELTGFKCKRVRNPLQITEEEKKPVLYLISATRLTPEKGKDRMKILADKFTNAGYRIIWLVFTNDSLAIDHPDVFYLPPRLDIRPFLASIKGKGYGVQVSNCEGDCYFTRECEALGVPLIVTPIPSFKEQGLVDGKNCYYVPFDMEDIDIDKIATKIPQYEPFLKEDGWKDELVKGKSTYNPNEIVKVVVTDKYYDVELGRDVKVGEKLSVTYNRYIDLIEEPAVVELDKEVNDE